MGMKTATLPGLLALAAETAFALPSAPPTETGPEAVRALIERLLPGRSGSFRLEPLPPKDGRDVFEIENAGGKIVRRGSSGVAPASALRGYLKQGGHGHVSFCGDRLRLPDPPAPAKIRRATPFRHRYCLNYCAFSYTMPFRDWPQRGRRIDRMPLQGIIEMRPPGGDPEFPAAMGRAIHRAMEAGDPRAVWVLQGWIFHFDRQFWQPPRVRALLGTVPDDRLGFLYDVVHLTRQVLANLTRPSYGKIATAYDRKDRAALAEAGRRFLDLLCDLDDLLATRREFLLGPWLADARRWATNEEERRLYEWNARNLITLWGPRDSSLHEHSQRQWSGMIRGFCLPRWKMFLDRLDGSLAEGKPLDAKALEDALRDWEAGWTRRTDDFPVASRGDPVAAARKMWEKYGRRAVPPPDALSLTIGKPATCSHALPQHPASLANDGRADDPERYWATDVAEHPRDAWWQVDLEKAETLGRVRVVFYYGDPRRYGFTVEGSNDGKTWEMLADRRDNREPSTAAGITCTFPPRPVRYLRVTVTGNSANTGRHLVGVLAFER